MTLARQSGGLLAILSRMPACPQAVLFGVVVVVLSWVIVRERTGAPLFTSKLVDVTSATSKDNI